MPVVGMEPTRNGRTPSEQLEWSEWSLSPHHLSPLPSPRAPYPSSSPPPPHSQAKRSQKSPEAPLLGSSSLPPDRQATVCLSVGLCLQFSVCNASVFVFLGMSLNAHVCCVCVFMCMYAPAHACHLAGRGCGIGWNGGGDSSLDSGEAEFSWKS